MSYRLTRLLVSEPVLQAPVAAGPQADIVVAPAGFLTERWPITCIRLMRRLGYQNEAADADDDQRSRIGDPGCGDHQRFIRQRHAPPCMG